MINGLELKIMIHSSLCGSLCMLCVSLCNFLFLCNSCSSNQSYINDDKTITSYFCEHITIGTWTNDWSAADSIQFENPDASDNRVVVKTLWNNDSLYFLFKVSDNILRAFQTEKDHPELYLDDMVEILIDANNDKDSCWKTDDIVYHINILGVKKDDRGTPDCQSDATWDGNARYTVRLFGVLNDLSGTATGYEVKIAFPWSELNLKPRKGLAIGVNFANGDNDGNGRQLFDWTGAWPLRSPYAFGTLILE